MIAKLLQAGYSPQFYLDRVQHGRRVKMRALVVDAQPIFRAAVANVLKSRSNQIEVCFAESLADALHCLENHGPELILADLSTVGVEDENGFERLMDKAGAAPVVVLDDRLQVSHVRRVQSARAKAYIAKTTSLQLIDAAIGVVIAGGEFFPHTPARGFLTEEAPAWVRSLTPQQLRVLRLLMEGKTNREVAEALKIEVSTAKIHVNRILNAAGARNRTEVVLKAKGPQ